MTFSGWQTRLLWLGLALLVAACTPARREVQGDIVKSIRFAGNDGLFSGHNDYQLRGAMVQSDTSFGLMVWPLIYWVDPQTLDERRLEREAYRLEVWYAHHGWFDAQVTGWHAERLRRANERRAGIVRLVGTVKPGTPSLVRELDIVGLNRGLSVLANASMRTANLRPGSQYVHDYALLDRQALLDVLLDHGRAYAKVELEVDAHPEQLAVDLQLRADAGILARFGPVSVEGNKKVRERFIRQGLGFAEGDPYKVRRIQKGQQSLFGMSTFSMVNVTPDLSDPTDPEVPITVRVTEARFRTFRVGGGVSLDNGLVQPRLSTGFRHVNLFHQLIRLDTDAFAGFSAVFLEDAGGRGLVPTYGVGAALAYPRIAGQRVTLQLSGRFDQRVQNALFLYQKPRADLKVIWRPDDAWIIEFGPHMEQYFYPNLSGAARRAIRRLFNQAPDEFKNPYRITSLDTTVTVDWRDDPLYSRRGSYGQIATRLALPIVAGDFSYASVSGDWRYYRPVRFNKLASDLPLVMAVRTYGRILRPFERGAALPYPDLAFLGGPNSLRGFRTNMVGPYDCLCTYDQDSEGNEDLYQRYYLPRGARTMAAATFELRYDWQYGLSFAGYSDVGVLVQDLSDINLSALRWGVGTGLRYKSVVGPIRIDVGFRPLFSEDAGPSAFPGCAEADRRPYRYDVFSLVAPVASRRPPVAMNVFLAIGEAF